MKEERIQQMNAKRKNHEHKRNLQRQAKERATSLG